MKNLSAFSLLLVLSLTIFISSCTEREFDMSSSAQLSFSTDTLSFDTIFTSFGSLTRNFKIYNPNDKFLRISKLKLALGENSYFRINVNGLTQSEISNIEIPPHDSLYVFVEVTVNPQNSSSPILVRDSIVFETNNNLQDVKLWAYGQDIHLIDGAIIGSQTWKNDKPYFVRHSMLVDTLETLTIEPGTIVHFSKESRLYVLGSLKVRGTKQDSVVFTSDRTDQIYDDVPGLWSGIHLLPGSIDNEFEYAVIKNAIVGIRADSMIITGKPTLSLHNTRIEHHTAAAIFAQGSSILATNSIFSDCGVYALSLQVGGSYEFYHCTVANYWGYTNRTTSSVIIRNYYFDINNNIQLRPIEKAHFYNCIIYGNKENEITLDGAIDAAFEYGFWNCLIRIDFESEVEDFSEFANSIFNNNPEFTNIRTYDYSLKKTSPAINLGEKEYVNSHIEQLKLDFNLQERISADQPDAGAIEYFEIIE